MSKYDIWMKYHHILKNKKNNVFMKNKNNLTPYDMILDRYHNNDEILLLFYNILSTSYYNIIIKNKIKSELIHGNYMDNIKKYIIKNRISIPNKKKKKYCIKINNNNKTYDNTTYTGITLDILFGLIYMNKKFKNITTTLSDNLTNNKNIINYYIDTNLINSLKGEYFNIEIYFINNKFFYPDNL
jgi:hypothetical protein